MPPTTAVKVKTWKRTGFLPGRRLVRSQYARPSHARIVIKSAGSIIEILPEVEVTRTPRPSTMDDVWMLMGDIFHAAARREMKALDETANA